MKKVKLFCYSQHILLVATMLVSGCMHQKESPKTDMPPQVGIPQNLNHLANAAKMAGVEDCLGRLNQVSNFLIKGNPNNSVAFFMPQQKYNETMFSTSFEIHLPQALTYTSAYFAPVGRGQCDGAYEAIAYWPTDCEGIAKKQFSQLKRLGKLHTTIQALDGGPQLRVFLMPAGPGCISIKKELIY